MKYWKLRASREDIPLYAASDTKMGAIQKVEALVGQLSRPIFEVKEIERSAIPEDDTVL